LIRSKIAKISAIFAIRSVIQFYTYLEMIGIVWLSKKIQAILKSLIKEENI
jgi:hypothetical protein